MYRGRGRVTLARTLKSRDGPAGRRSVRGRVRHHPWLGVVVLWCVALALAPGGAVWGLDLTTQLTPGAAWDSSHTAVSADGSAIAFATMSDMLGTNPDHSMEIFFANAKDGTLTQLTSDPSYNSRLPWLSADGSVVAFWSQADVAGGNPDHSREVFVINSDGTGLTQLTSDPTYDTMPAGISGDGSLVVFYSEADHTGGNPDHSYEVFVIKSDGTNLTQLTDDPVYGSEACAISLDGSVVVFESQADLVPGSNTDHEWEIFKINPDGTGLTQMTSDPVYRSRRPTVSGDGSVIAFDSLANWLGNNADHSCEVFVVNSDGTGLTQLTAVTTLTKAAADPIISADGSVVVFMGCADFTGGNPEEIPQIFRVNADGTGLEQLTYGAPAWDCSWPCSVSADGSIIGLWSVADLTGANPGHDMQAYLIQFGLGIAQLTLDAGESSDSPSISADGSLLAFSSRTNHTGGNPDNSNEIFVVKSDGTGLTQLTDSPLHSSGSFAGTALSADGSRIAFESTADLVAGENLDHSYEVFVINTDGTGLTQLTADPVVDSRYPSISGDGSLVTFATVIEIPGDPPVYTGEVFVVNADGTGLTQLTNAPGKQSGWPRISPDGSVITFYSNADLVGNNADGGDEVFIVHPDGTGLVQLTDSASATYGSYSGSVSGDGTVVAFSSLADLTGENPAHDFQIFVINSDGTGLKQITHAADAYLWAPMISADGSRVACWGCDGPDSSNPDDSPEIYVVNTDGTGFRQLTAVVAFCAGCPSITADGSTVAFFAADDLVPGWNTDSYSEIFLVDLDRFFMAELAPGTSVPAPCGDVTVTFDTVTGKGSVSVTLCEEPPAESPGGFSFLGQYYDITTDATYTGPITIEIHYDDTGMTQQGEEALALLHWESGGWVDVTIPPVDTVNNIIRGEVTELSPFAPAMMDIAIFGGFLQPINPDGSSVFKAGRTIPVKFSLTDGFGDLITDAVCYLSLTQISSEIMGSVEETAEAVYEDLGDTFRYDEEGGQYIYNLSTKDMATGTWVLRVTVDGWPEFEETVQIGLR